MQLCRKDNLSRNLKKHKKLLEKEGKAADAKGYDFFPMTFHLPLEYGLFADEFKKATDKNIWIMKPTSKSQGKGIFLFNRINAISAWTDTQA
jgi:tubulin polyglutamylase TTLL9